MTIRFTGVHFLYKPSADERRYIEAAVKDTDGVILRDKGDVLILDTGSAGENPLDFQVMEGISGIIKPLKAADYVLEQIMGFWSASRWGERRAAHRKKGQPDALTPKELVALQKPNYFLVTTAGALSVAEQDAAADRLAKTGELTL